MKMIIYGFLVLSFINTSFAKDSDLTPIYWYNGKHKMNLYLHHNLYVKAKVMPLLKKENVNGMQLIAERNNWKIYRSHIKTINLNEYSNLYSTGRDWQNSVLYAQAEGILVIFKEGIKNGRILSFFKRKNFYYQKLSLPNAYLIKNIYGEQAINLSRELYESNLFELSVPNWITTVQLS